MGKYLKDRELDSVLESYFNEGIKDIFKKKKKEKDDYWSDNKIKSTCEALKEWLKEPKNVSYNKAVNLFTIALVLNKIPEMEKKYKAISDPKNECNWDDIVNDIYLDREFDDPITGAQYKELGLNNFPEAKKEKLLLSVFDTDDTFIYMSKKSGKIISYDWKNRYDIYQFKYFAENMVDPSLTDIPEKRDKVKEIWNEIK